MSQTPTSPRASSPSKGHGWRLAAAAASAQQAQIRKTVPATAPSFTTLREANAYLNGQVTLLKARLAECLSREETEVVKARIEAAEERGRSLAVDLEASEARGQSAALHVSALQQEVSSLREELARAAERDRLSREELKEQQSAGAERYKLVLARAELQAAEAAEDRAALLAAQEETAQEVLLRGQTAAEAEAAAEVAAAQLVAARRHAAEAEAAAKQAELQPWSPNLNSHPTLTLALTRTLARARTPTQTERPLLRPSRPSCRGTSWRRR